MCATLVRLFIIHFLGRYIIWDETYMSIESKWLGYMLYNRYYPLDILYMFDIYL